MEESISGRSKVEDSVVETTPRPTMWRTISDSSGIIGGEAR